MIVVFDYYKILYNWWKEEVEENEELDGRSPYYRQKQKLLLSQRQNRIRGILTKQLKSRNHSLIDERSNRFKSKYFSRRSVSIFHFFRREQGESTIK